MLEKLFKFPVIVLDGDKEEKKHERIERLGLPSEDEEPVRIITAEIEVPYFDFVSVMDRWLPTDDSYEKALNGEFDACWVVFLHSGGFLVPWNKSKFKREYKKFVDLLPKEVPIVLNFKTKEDLLDFYDKQTAKPAE